MRSARILLLVVIGILPAAPRSAYCAGVYPAGQTTRIFEPSHLRNWRGARTEGLNTTIWYPASPDSSERPQLLGPPDAPLFFAGNTALDAALAPRPLKFPVILLSHGTGGSAAQLAWLGTELARHGYIAAAVNHPGNNSLEPYTAEGFTLWWERATDLSDALDQLILDPTFGPRVDGSRVGAAGFSIGGYTVLALAGARIDQSAFFKFCAANSKKPTCHVPEMHTLGDTQQILARTRATSADSLARSGASYRDPRIGAVFAIAPAVGQAFKSDSFRGVAIPISMVVGDLDPIAPAADGAARIKQLDPGATLAILPGVSHYTFLDTCAPAGESTVVPYCQDAPGVDREKVHVEVAGMALQFFANNLR
jgi:predicted dienelactone hydrolase